jgi:hypothetical protein
VATKVKGKLFLCLFNKALRHEDVWGSGYIYTHVFLTSTLVGVEWSASCLGTHWIRGWVDPVAIQTALAQLLHMWPFHLSFRLRHKVRRRCFPKTYICATVLLVKSRECCDGLYIHECRRQEIHAQFWRGNTYYNVQKVLMFLSLKKYAILHLRSFLMQNNMTAQNLHSTVVTME